MRERLLASGHRGGDGGRGGAQHQARSSSRRSRPSAGAFLAPRLAWRTDRIRVLVTVSLCARFCGRAAGPLCSAAGLGTLVSGLRSGAGRLPALRYPLAPMISAIALPVLLGTELGLPRRGLPADGPHPPLPLGAGAAGAPGGRAASPPVPPAAADWRAAGLRLALAAPAPGRRWRWTAAFAVAPPLLVAFTEFSSAAAARKRPFRAGAAIVLCALAGTASHALIQGPRACP